MNEVRPIDALEATRILSGFDQQDVYLPVHFQEMVLDECHTLDYEPVVRCENCIHYFGGACLKIYSDGNISVDAWQKRKPQDFCSYGKTEEMMRAEIGGALMDEEEPHA